MEQNLMQKLTERIAEYLYGHPRSKAIEWAKEDKFDSCAHQAGEILGLVMPTVADRCVEIVRADLAEPEPFRYEGSEMEQAIRNLFDPEI